MKTIIKASLLTEVILDYFTDVIGGIFSEIAWKDLLEISEDYIKNPSEKTLKKLNSLLEFNFGIEKEDFKKILKEYRKKVKGFEKYEA